MKYILGIVVGLLVSIAVLAGDQMEQHIQAEGAYWLKGIPNDHQRYSALCGAVTDLIEQSAGIGATR